MSPGVSAAALVTYRGFDPIAVSVAHPEIVLLSVQTDGSPSDVVLELASGPSRPLTNHGSGFYTTTVTHEEVLYGYQPDDVNRNFVGFLEIFSGASLLLRGSLFIEVHDASIPDVAVNDLAPDMRASPRIVNIQVAHVDPGNLVLSEVTTRFYEEFPDSFDFLNIISTPNRFANRYHLLIRNFVDGIGLSIFDNSAAYGSDGVLQGINRYPITGLFDLAETASLHELGHQWINFSDLPALQGVIPHWPISSLAPGIMGFQHPSNPQGLAFPFDLVPIGGGDFLLVDVPRQRFFSGMELYLMGMARASQAGSYFVFQNQNQTVCGGCILEGPTEDVTANDWIAHEGPRVPVFPDAQVDYRVATILVSRSRLLTDREMQVFDFFAARGEAEVELPYSSGFSKGTTLPFKLATLGVGSLDARLGFASCQAANGEEFILSDDTILTSQTYEACNTIIVGPNLTVLGPDGELILR
ncbi:MAG: hypothetical protein WBG93_05185, partial [Thermoanaerobaculia bacterium]